MAVIKWESAAVTEGLYTCEYTSAEIVQVMWFCTAAKFKRAFSQVQQGFISEHHMVSHAHITFKNEFRVAVPVPSK